MLDEFDTTIVELSKLEELVDAQAQLERMARSLIRYLAEHDRKAGGTCTCAWCTEARDLVASHYA